LSDAGGIAWWPIDRPWTTGVNGFRDECSRGSSITAFTRSPIETIPINRLPSTAGRWRTRNSVHRRMHSSTLVPGETVVGAGVMISDTGVSREERPFRITLRA